MLDGSVFAEVEVPLEGVEGQAVLLDSRLKQVLVGYALGATDDFAIALGGEDVDAESLGVV